VPVSRKSILPVLFVIVKSHGATNSTTAATKL